MSDKELILNSYGQYSKKLAQLLKQGVPLLGEERGFIENHLVIVQLALTTSKHDHPSSTQQ